MFTLLQYASLGQRHPRSAPQTAWSTSPTTPADHAGRSPRTAQGNLRRRSHPGTTRAHPATTPGRPCAPWPHRHRTRRPHPQAEKPRVPAIPAYPDHQHGKHRTPPSPSRSHGVEEPAWRPTVSDPQSDARTRHTSTIAPNRPHSGLPPHHVAKRPFRARAVQRPEHRRRERDLSGLLLGRPRRRRRPRRRLARTLHAGEDHRPRSHARHATAHAVVQLRRKPLCLLRNRNGTAPLPTLHPADLRRRLPPHRPVLQLRPRQLLPRRTRQGRMA